MIRVWLHILLLFLGTGCVSAQSPSLYSQKAGHLYKYAKYLHWETNHNNHNFTIALLSNDKAFLEMLRKKFKTMTLKGKPIRFVTYTGQPVDNFQILFASKDSVFISSLGVLPHQLIITDGFKTSNSILSFSYSNDSLSVYYNKALAKQLKINFSIPISSISEQHQVFHETKDKKTNRLFFHSVNPSYLDIILLSLGLIFVNLIWTLYVLKSRSNRKNSDPVLDCTDTKYLLEHLEYKSKQVIVSRKDAFVVMPQNGNAIVWAVEDSMKGVQAKRMYVLFGYRAGMTDTSKIKLQIKFERAIFCEELSDPEEILTFIFDKPTFVPKQLHLGILRLDEFSSSRISLHFAGSGQYLQIWKRQEKKLGTYPIHYNEAKELKGNINIYKFDLKYNDSIYLFHSFFFNNAVGHKKREAWNETLEKTEKQSIEEQYEYFRNAINIQYGTEQTDSAFCSLGIRV